MSPERLLRWMRWVLRPRLCGSFVKKKPLHVVTLKKNHPTLYKQVKTWFETARANQFGGIEVSEDSRTEKAHHRVETRKVWAVPVAALGRLYKQEDSADIQTIGIVERFRYLWNTTTHEVQFYLSSLPVDAQVNGRAIRQHWSIENQEHWILDVTFNEDRCRIRSLNSLQELGCYQTDVPECCQSRNYSQA